MAAMSRLVPLQVCFLPSCLHAYVLVPMSLRSFEALNEHLGKIFGFKVRAVCYRDCCGGIPIDKDTELSTIMDRIKDLAEDFYFSVPATLLVRGNPKLHRDLSDSDSDSEDSSLLEKEMNPLGSAASTTTTAADDDDNGLCPSSSTCSKNNTGFSNEDSSAAVDPKNDPAVAPIPEVPQTALSSSFLQVGDHNNPPYHELQQEQPRSETSSDSASDSVVHLEMEEKYQAKIALPTEGNPAVVTMKFNVLLSPGEQLILKATHPVNTIKITNAEKLNPEGYEDGHLHARIYPAILNESGQYAIKMEMLAGKKMKDCLKTIWRLHRVNDELGIEFEGVGPIKRLTIVKASDSESDSKTRKQLKTSRPSSSMSSNSSIASHSTIRSSVKDNSIIKADEEVATLLVSQSHKQDQDPINMDDLRFKFLACLNESRAPTITESVASTSIEKSEKSSDESSDQGKYDDVDDGEYQFPDSESDSSAADCDYTMVYKDDSIVPNDDASRHSIGCRKDAMMISDEADSCSPDSVSLLSSSSSTASSSLPPVTVANDSSVSYFEPVTPNIQNQQQQAQQHREGLAPIEPTDIDKRIVSMLNEMGFLRITPPDNIQGYLDAVPEKTDYKKRLISVLRLITGDDKLELASLPEPQQPPILTLDAWEPELIPDDAADGLQQLLSAIYRVSDYKIEPCIETANAVVSECGHLSLDEQLLAYYDRIEFSS